MIVQHYTFRCDMAGCDVEEGHVTPLAGYSTQLPLDAWPPRPELPPGWHRIDNGIVCPKHPTVDVRSFVS